VRHLGEVKDDENRGEKDTIAREESCAAMNSSTGNCSPRATVQIFAISCRN